MKKALISPNEPVESGYRVAEVIDVAFEVAEPLFWFDCADDVVADQFYYDPTDKSIKAVPIFEPKIVKPVGSAPNVTA